MMIIVKKAVLWLIVSLLLMISLMTIPNFCCFAALIIALLIAPIEKWQKIISKYIKKTIKIIAIIVLVLLMFGTFPTSDLDSADDLNEVSSNLGSENVSNEGSADEEISEAVSKLITETSKPIVETSSKPVAEVSSIPIKETSSQDIGEASSELASVETHTHTYSDATCNQPKTCSCGETEGSALGHKWVEASCTQAKHCSRCNKTEGTTAKHSWKDATYTKPKTCSSCGATEGNPLDVPKKENYHGHVYTGGDKSTKYHYEADCAGKYSHEITWEEVDRRELEPCSKCVLK